MKIAVIVNYQESILSFRGALLYEFIKAGHEVIVFAPGEDGDVIERLKRMGVTYRPVRLDRTGTSPVKDFIAFVAFVRIFRELRPDIVLCYTIKPIIYCSLAARLSGVPRIYSIIAGLGYVFIGNSWKHKILRSFVCRLYRTALSFNTTIFFLNQDDINSFYSHRIITNLNCFIKINGEGIDLAQFNCQNNTNIEISDPNDIPNARPSVEMLANTTITFLLIGRLIKDKGILEYVEAARILFAKYANVKFQLLGPLDSNPTAINMKQIEKWQGAGIIEYLGETKDVRPFIASSSVYVLPSYREGLPRTVLEAMAMERPIVTTDAPGCRETVVNGDNGFLVPVKDVNALAAAMERFVLQPKLIESMGLRSRKIAEEKYDVHKVNAVILQAMGLA